LTPLNNPDTLTQALCFNSPLVPVSLMIFLQPAQLVSKYKWHNLQGMGLDHLPNKITLAPIQHRVLAFNYKDLLRCISKIPQRTPSSFPLESTELAAFAFPHPFFLKQPRLLSFMVVLAAFLRHGSHW